jgi:SSS family transporter
MPRFLAALLRLLLIALAAWPMSTRAESLSSVHSGALPAVPEMAEPITLLGFGGRLVALTAQASWVLDESGVAWSRTPWQPGGAVAGVAQAAPQSPHAVLLLAATATQPARAERLFFVNGALASEPLPAWPEALSHARAALLGDTLFVAGTDTSGASRLLQRSIDGAATPWRSSAGWPGSARLRSLVGQTSGVVAVVCGAADQPDRLWRWTADAGWADRGSAPGHVLEASGRPIGQAHVLYLVRPLPNEPAGAAQLMTWHTITGSWAALPMAPAQGIEATAAWKNGVAWEQRAADGARSELAFAEVEAGKLLLKPLDWLVIVVYLVSMLGMGLYFYLREKRQSTSEFFVGGRSIPFWAAGVSLYAANTSSISYIAIPAKAFETNWTYLTNNLVAVLGLMFVAVWIVPLLRRLDLMSVFHYLEIRFHPAIRMLASALCIAVQIGSRMSVVLFLPALAIATITGLDVAWSVLIMGGFTIVYTAMGGMRAVIWTDFVQLIVKMGGALFAIGFIVCKLHGGIGELLDTAASGHKTKLLDFSFDLTKATVWGFIFLVVFDVVLTFPKDQVLMQRVLSTKSDKEAGRSIWAFAAIMIPGGFVFYSIGTALFVYYKANPERMNPLLGVDATFPLFIAAELPTGITGLIVAGIFAAAMATLSSIMNSVATLASVDFYERLVKQPDPKKSVRFAEAMTIVAGLLGIGAALLLSRFDIHSLFDVSIELAGLLGGGFAGAYTLGMFTRRANSAGVAIGVGCSIVLTTVAWSMKLVHPYFYLAISILLCIVIGYLASLLFPAPRRSLAGLTIHGDVAAATERAGEAARVV